MKVLVIGGGLFGCSSAFTISGTSGITVDLVERNADIMLEASHVNHNRIHLGYHYLRSIETAEQSIEGLLSFLFNFGDSVMHQFPNYYGIALDGSKTNADQFVDFCNRVGIGYEEEFPSGSLLDASRLQACFRVPEPIWDYSSLKRTVWQYLHRSRVNVMLNTSCTSIRQLPDATFGVQLSDGSEHVYDIVINAAYSQLNSICEMLGLASKRLLYEDVFIPVFEYDAAPFGLTVMDGPFCSVMPRGRNPKEFLLYHVRESVLQSRIDVSCPAFGKFTSEQLNQTGIFQKSAYFMPFLEKAQLLDVTRTVRTVYENSDDARLSEIFVHEDVKNFYSVLSGKVTTCIQVALELKHRIKGRVSNKRFKI